MCTCLQRAATPRQTKKWFISPSSSNELTVAYSRRSANLRASSSSKRRFNRGTNLRLPLCNHSIKNLFNDGQVDSENRLINELRWRYRELTDLLPYRSEGSNMAAISTSRRDRTTVNTRRLLCCYFHPTTLLAWPFQTFLRRQRALMVRKKALCSGPASNPKQLFHVAPAVLRLVNLY